jgi:glucose/arabinose dehydrogenase
LDEIWAIGLRNPWRFSFDRLTGDLYIGDVGQSQWEEVDFQANGNGGVNFGWDCREGSTTYSGPPDGPSPACNDAGLQASLVNPIAEYNHSLGIAVTGGFIYRGSQYPALVGHYFYADYGSGRIWSMHKSGPNTWDPPEQELDTNFLISAFGEDEQGELYVVEYSSNDGKIHRLADVNGPNFPSQLYYFPIIFK